MLTTLWQHLFKTYLSLSFQRKVYKRLQFNVRNKNSISEVCVVKFLGDRPPQALVPK